MDTSGPMINSSTSAVFVGDVISRLYPNVNQQETALPRQWSSIHKCQTLQLSNGNLRVTYKGPGKTHKDAASVRTDYPIPAACGIYYYEVKIISKGRDGYMGIGLSKSEVQLNRLPGWDKNSYGYHGDDGHSFCCSGTGQNYGPTFTTGDVIGCCLNLIENTCFYTKNGYNLGIAFRDLPSDLYPTVGLQTPSESVEANFGQYPFEFDIHNYVKEWHLKTRHTIEKFPLKKETENNLPIILRKLISTYLVHHGYSSTAEAFAKSVGHVFEEELASIRNRQRIQKLVLNGSLGEAIDLTYQLFPGILERNSNLLFALKVRQFIEMINNSNNNELSATSSSSRGSEISSTSNELKQNSLVSSKLTALSSLSSELNTTTTTMLVDCDQQSTRFHINGNNNGYSNLKYSLLNTNSNASSSANEEAMEMDSSPTHLTTVNKKNSNTNEDASCQCVNPKQAGPLLFNLDYEYSNLHKILQFGRELFQMNTTLDPSDSHANSKMLRDAFSLLAYHDPWNSPLGFQLDQSQREPISALLNSAILEANNMPRIPPLEVVYGQTSECMRLMSKYGVAWCAYVNLNDYMQS